MTKQDIFFFLIGFGIISFLSCNLNNKTMEGLAKRKSVFDYHSIESIVRQKDNESFITISKSGTDYQVDFSDQMPTTYSQFELFNNSSNMLCVKSKGYGSYGSDVEVSKNILIVDSFGIEIENLTKHYSRSLYQTPHISKDDKFLFFTALRNRALDKKDEDRFILSLEALGSFYIMDMKTRDTVVSYENISIGNVISDYQSWSPNSDKILLGFSRGIKNYNTEDFKHEDFNDILSGFYIYDIKENSFEKIINYVPTDFCWSPLSDKIIYSFVDKIYSYEISTQTSKLIHKVPRKHCITDIRWIPGTNSLIFIEVRFGKLGLFSESAQVWEKVLSINTGEIASMDTVIISHNCEFTWK